jgi:hypothetical protein
MRIRRVGRATRIPPAGTPRWLHRERPGDVVVLSRGCVAGDVRVVDRHVAARKELQAAANAGTRSSGRSRVTGEGLTSPAARGFPPTARCATPEADEPGWPAGRSVRSDGVGALGLL